MSSTFNPQILVEKLAKLNSSQQSIETLSHWCIFHMHKAKQVVETWDRQFHSSPRDQRLAFLYLANDILQNSRRKGSEFVGEFWKFLPNALRDVINNGDEFAKSAALRLISIWEERKVFGSRGQILKEEIAARHIDNNNTTTKNGKSSSAFKLKHSGGNALEKIVSGYQVIYCQLDEDSVLSKYRNAVSCVEKVDKEIVSGNINSDQFNGSAVVDELKGQHAILRECIEQLAALKKSRTDLVSNLREALQEQELKLDEVRIQLQRAQSVSEQANNICWQLLPHNQSIPISIRGPPPHSTAISGQSFISGGVELKTSPLMYATTDNKSSSSHEEGPKSAAAAMAAKLTASTSSAETLSYVLSSLVSGGIIGNSTKESDHSDYPSENKRLKLETDHSAPYIPPIPPFPQNEHPPPPSSPPPLLPLPPQAAYPMPTQFANVAPYGYGTTQQQLPPLLPPYQNVVAAPPPFYAATSTANTYKSTYQTEGVFYSQPMSPISRQ